MNYNFDEIIPRRGSNSYKWDTTKEDVLPMWVADMDFRAAPTIIEALQKRVEHGIFGYTKVPPQYYEAVVNWFERRHNWQIRKDWIVYTSGVVPAISAIIKALTVPGDCVLVQTPVYNCFFSSIANNDCGVVTNPLININGKYFIDFDDLERKTSDPKVKLMILCNPHNPVGRVWTKDELMRIGKICLKNRVTVVADEIHCELVYPGHTYTPFGSLSKELLINSITCISPSKAFNLAGLQIANIISANVFMRIRVEKAININEVCDVNPFGVEALIAAYNNGEQWLEALKLYLLNNRNYLKAYFEEHLPQLTVTMAEGSYLIWVDCRALGMSSKEIVNLLLEKAHILVSEGSIYGESGENFIRINIACPKGLLVDGLERLRSVLTQQLRVESYGEKADSK